VRSVLDRCRLSVSCEINCQPPPSSPPGDELCCRVGDPGLLRTHVLVDLPGDKARVRAPRVPGLLASCLLPQLRSDMLGECETGGGKSADMRARILRPSFATGLPRFAASSSAGALASSTAARVVLTSSLKSRRVPDAASMKESSRACSSARDATQARTSKVCAWDCAPVSKPLSGQSSTFAPPMAKKTNIWRVRECRGRASPGAHVGENDGTGVTGGA